MSTNQTQVTVAKWAELAKKDIVVGLGVIKAMANDCAFGYIWALPGGETTRSKKHATKAAAHINYLICKSA